MLRAGQATKLGSIPGMGKSFLVSSVPIPALRPPGQSCVNSGYIVRGVKLTIGVTWDVPGGGENAPPMFFLRKIFFFFLLLIWRGENKKYKYFQNYYLDGARTEKNGKPAFYRTQNRGILVPMVDFAHPSPTTYLNVI